MERMLYKWYKRQKNLPVGGEMLKEKAKLLHEKLEEEGGFNGSSGWLDGFKSRFGVRLLKICGEKLSSDHSAVAPFKNNFAKTIHELQLSQNQIYNADESGLFWKLLPEKTYVAREEKTSPGRKVEKARITFLACTNATGLHKIKPMIIGKSKKPRCFKNFDIPVDYRSSKNAWMTTDIFKDWFHNLFVPQVQDFLRKEGLPIKAVLLLDNAPCHPSEALLKTDDGSIFTMYMPPNVTPLIQPMDQNAIRVTKLYYRKSLLRLAVGKKDVLNFLKSLTIKDAVSLFAIAWSQLKPDVIEKCWRNILPQICMYDIETQSSDEEEDTPLNLLRDKFRQQQLEEINELQNLLQIIIPEATPTVTDINTWNAIDDTVELNESELELITSDEDEIDEPENQTKITASEAIQIFDKGIEWAEENTSDYSDILVLKKMRERAVLKVLANKKKQTLYGNCCQSVFFLTGKILDCVNNLVCMDSLCNN
ncbi:jerky protein homolog-like [Eupeodes corollae]|uniref:jerky protein homolog-like n=1 Tax=Eupeodes corollae TaxID=290404 RepID=UPI0024906298|nr:jerky protein homolog-like [Eupeodes corollae]